MSSSAINAQLFQAKIGSIQNQADSSSVYSAGVWSFKNSTALTSVTITDSGNVGIGTASFSSPASISPKLFVNQIIKFGSYSYIGEDLLDADSLGLVCDSTENICFGQINTGTNTLTERMRIDASGNLLVGTTSSFNTGSGLQVRSSNGIALRGTSSTDGSNLQFHASDTGSRVFGITGNAVNLYIFDADFSHYAYLPQNPTSWLFGSDRRIKENIEDCKYGLSEVLAIQPRKYKFSASGKEDIGFIAQELREVIPEAVSGVEQEFSEDDTPQERANKTLGVSKDTLIPVLVKAIQEQQAQIEALRAEVAALKAP